MDISYIFRQGIQGNSRLAAAAGQRRM